LDPTELALIFFSLALGGVLKGATGAGAPVIAVPVLAMLFNAKIAVVIMLMPNLLTNVWQAWKFRHHLPPRGFVLTFTAAGAVGVLIGTAMLASFPHEVLSLIVAFTVYAYIVFRLLRPDWSAPLELACRFAFPAGLGAGLLQGSSGISAPVSLTFLNAMHLERNAFIATASTFFVAVTALQIPTLGALGIISPSNLLISLAAIVPISLFMPVGSRIAERFSKQAFDRLTLVLLALLATKLMLDAIGVA
jgi:uncharacterized membrane protein YfcA